MARKGCAILLFGYIAFIFCKQISALTDNDRFDCYPLGVGGAPTSTKCTNNNCVWKAKPNGAAKAMPECFYNTSIKYGYDVLPGQGSINNGKSRVVYLTRKSVLPENGVYANSMKNVSMDIEHQTESRLRITFRDATRKRFEVPVQKNFANSKANVQNPSYIVTHEISNGHTFKVNRYDGKNRKAIFDTGVGALVLADQFLQISAKLESANCYGFGEHEHQAFMLDFNWSKLGMFSRDQPPGPDGNLYGVHPFYMCLESDGKAHGVLLLNSNAMDVTLQPLPAITFRTIGGVLDFYFFMGPTPSDVINQYTELIGRTFMPPYWSLGFQLCRYGYNSLAKVKETVARMRQFDIPQDVQYGDIDYMDRQLDFTINPKTYLGLENYVREIKVDGIRYITILDPAISANETAGKYEPYDLGNKLDIFIKAHNSSEPLFGKVWPDLPNVVVDETKSWDYQVKNYRAYAAFPDFTHPNISAYWGKLIVDFHKRIEYDGIWIDMNEPASFVPGSVDACPRNNSLEEPPYRPAIFGSTIYDKTICMTARHWDCSLQYDMHSLYGWSQTEPTYHANAKGTGKRPLVISRSTYPSSGKHAGHWLGDNTSVWPHMKYSIIGMLEFGLFGIPYIGADICGFFQDTTEELCDRWMALGAFYPFSRNHNGKGYKEQDPGVFGAAFAKRSRDVLRIRYNLLPYLYTLFYESTVNGAPVVRPLFFEFTSDKKTWNIDEQFMWGNSLLITPILRQNQNTSVVGYFPNTTWFDYHTGKELEKWNRGTKVSLKVTKQTLIHLHVRGGTIMPTQDPANNTMFSRKNPMGLIIALNDQQKAQGKLFWDDGESIDTVRKSQYQHMNFSADKDSVRFVLTKNGYSAANKFTFEHLKVFGTKMSPGTKLTVKNKNSVVKDAKCSIDKNGVLMITGLKLSLDQEHSVSWYRDTSSGYRISFSVITWLLCMCILGMV